MKLKELIIVIFVIVNQSLFAQFQLSDKQKYMINEWKDAYGGKIYYAYNYPKTYEVYKELKRYFIARGNVVTIYRTYFVFPLLSECMQAKEN